MPPCSCIASRVILHHLEVRVEMAQAFFPDQ
jgi:hypothetical protein